MFLETSIAQSILLVVGILLVVSLLLILVLLFVKEKLAPSGPVKIKINGEKEIEVASGDSLLTTLSAQKSFFHLLVEVEVPAFNVSVMSNQEEVKHFQPKPLILQEKNLSQEQD